jgi:catechol 2,3-dioxygenase-like lactoylglutathione lyase family enzyme
VVVIKQMRLVVHAADYEEAVQFYRDSLGMPELESYSGNGGAEVMILDAGRATLELSNTAQIEFIDAVEVGERVAPHLRVAFEVADSEAATRIAVDAGARLIAEPVETPWRSLNSRLDGPAGLQLTLFEELD